MMKRKLIASLTGRGLYEAWGANDDGTGYVRKEGEDIVALELDGPGVLWRIWSALPQAGHIRIEIDGRLAVDQPFRGAPYLADVLWHRKGFLVGMALAAAFVALACQRVWQVEYKGLPMDHPDMVALQQCLTEAGVAPRPPPAGAAAELLGGRAAQRRAAHGLQLPDGLGVFPL